ncbi:protein of unknown function [Mucilaginibacter gossypiicola]|uniref:DUF4393 domain-containing protein n=1 Tax=Mucilaginibacter gossypiicola TaxID=551995 RepID=A0A1H8DWM2_9SPHI|nr:Abi-alpha family protein [Mucilaginibacter gossypiicola]SEN11566.1 protein of unknown function [Mucilaginibacter gossypiicola]
MADLEKLGNILGAETIKRIYEDGFSGSVQEAGKMLTDLMKSLRLFTLPFQLSANYQDRITKYFEKVRASVPEANQIQAPASISGPIIERLKYLEENNYLTDLYLNLLSRAIDKERINDAHPAFFHIIDQLSPDEAMLLYALSKDCIYYDYTMDLREDGKRFINTIVKKDTTPKEKIVFLENFNMYIEHMKSLNLVFWQKTHEEAIRVEKKQTGTYIHTQIELTEFGSWFVKACIPENGFIIS